MDKDNQCNCNEHDHDHACDCGCDEEMQYINLTLDDGEEVEYGVIGIFDAEDREYIALVSDEDEVLIYRYKEVDDESVDLENIETDEEFEMVSEVFMDLFVEEDEEDEE